MRYLLRIIALSLTCANGSGQSNSKEKKREWNAYGSIFFFFFLEEVRKIVVLIPKALFYCLLIFENGNTGMESGLSLLEAAVA